MNGIAYRLARPGLVRQRNKESNVSKNFAFVALRVEHIPFAVRALFLSFIFTLPFDAVDLMNGWVSIAKIAGMLFFACYFFYHNPVFQKRFLPPMPRALRWFIGYFVIYAAQLLVVPEEFSGTMISLLFTFAQLLLFFWIASDLLKHEGLNVKFCLHMFWL